MMKPWSIKYPVEILFPGAPLQETLFVCLYVCLPLPHVINVDLFLIDDHDQSVLNSHVINVELPLIDDHDQSVLNSHVINVELPLIDNHYQPVLNSHVPALQGFSHGWDKVSSPLV